MEQISRSLQTERTNLKQQVKVLEEKFNSLNVSESPVVETQVTETKTEEVNHKTDEVCTKVEEVSPNTDEVSTNIEEVPQKTEEEDTPTTEETTPKIEEIVEAKVEPIVNKPSQIETVPEPKIEETAQSTN